MEEERCSSRELAIAQIGRQDDRVTVMGLASFSFQLIGHCMGLASFSFQLIGHCMGLASFSFQLIGHCMGLASFSFQLIWVYIPHMVVQCTSLCKALTTRTTRVRFLPRVRTPVLYKVLVECNTSSCKSRTRRV